VVEIEAMRARQIRGKVPTIKPNILAVAMCSPLFITSIQRMNQTPETDLVTGDEDLLSLAGGFACPIVTAEKFMKTLFP
jgi:hypothetical protein